MSEGRRPGRDPWHPPVAKISHRPGPTPQRRPSSPASFHETGPGIDSGRGTDRYQLSADPMATNRGGGLLARANEAGDHPNSSTPMVGACLTRRSGSWNPTGRLTRASRGSSAWRHAVREPRSVTCRRRRAAGGPRDRLPRRSQDAHDRRRRLSGHGTRASPP